VTYPEPRYHSDHGEISAVFRAATADPELTFGAAGAASMSTPARFEHR
jgi:hypothetical protein